MVMLTWKFAYCLIVLSTGLISVNLSDKYRKNDEFDAESYSISITRSGHTRIGNKSTLNCSVSTNLYKMKFSWFKDDNYLHDKPILILENITEKHGGIYKCTAVGQSENNVTLVFTTQMFLKINQKQNEKNKIAKRSDFNQRMDILKIHKRDKLENAINISQSPLAISIEKAFIMKCKVDFNLANVRYSWYKNDVLISESDILSFKTLSRDDIGSYKCVVYGTIGNNMKKKLEVTTSIRRPIMEFESQKYWIEIVPSPIRYEMGKKLTLKCLVTSKLKDPKYMWLKNDNTMFIGQTLSIENLRENNIGSYNCTVKGTGKENGSVVLTAKYTISKYIITEYKSRSQDYCVQILQSHDQLVKGKHFAIQCKVTPRLKNTQYLWYKDYDIIPGNETLSFARLSDDHRGSYKCIAIGNDVNNVKITLEASYSITSLSNNFESPGSKIPMDNSNIESEFALRCNVFSRISDAKYLWYKDEKAMSNKDILSVERLSKNKIEFYKCISNGTSINNTKIGIKVIITIMPPDNSENTSLSLKIIAFENPSSNGKNILLQCRAVSYVKNPQYTWERNGKVISKEQTITVEKSTIDNTQAYKCTVTGLDENNKETKYHVEKSKYEIYEIIKNLSVDTNIIYYTVEIIQSTIDSSNRRNILLQCHVTPSLKNTKYIWEQNGKEISQQQNITIERSSEDENNIYKCLVTGLGPNNGNIKMKATINMKNSKIQNSWIKISPSSEKFEIGQRFSMQCQVNRIFKAVQITWYKDNSFFSNNENVLFETISEKDFGTYTCIAIGTTEDNQQQSDRIFIHLGASHDSSVDTNIFHYTVEIIQSTIDSSNRRNILLQCHVTPSLKNTKYIWKQNGREISQQQNITIERSSEDENNIYKCLVTGLGPKNGNIKMNATLNMNNSKRITYKIEIISSEQFELGKKFTMRCQVTPQPKKMQLSWYKDNVFLSNDETLTFQSIRAEDTGSYQCIANLTLNNQQRQLIATFKTWLKTKNAEI